MTFLYDSIHYDATVRGNELRVKVRGDIQKDFLFKAPNTLNEPLALLTAHICSVPFQIQAKKCVVTPALKHERMDRLVRIFKANLSTYVSLYPDYPNDVHITSIDEHDALKVLSALNTVHIEKLDHPAIAVSTGKESLLGWHLLNAYTRVSGGSVDTYAVNNANMLAQHMIKCPLSITRHPLYGPSGWRQEYNMTLPWRIFTLASVSACTDWLIFGDEYETNQCFELSKGRFFFTDDFDQSVYVSGLINWAVKDLTNTRVSSLVGNLCEMQIQGIVDAVVPSKVRRQQISCWTDTRWCCDCAKCNRFSLLFEALHGRPDPLPSMPLNFIDRMDPVRMWNYCHALKGNPRYESSSFYTPGRKSLDLIRILIKMRRGMRCLPVSTDFLRVFQTSDTLPLIDTPFNDVLAAQLEQFESRIQRKMTQRLRVVKDA